MYNKKNNKGFSLVELIVVIAVMAVLVGVLAPAYLRYVDKAKLQKDVSAVSEVVECIKMAASEQDVAAEIGETAVSITINADDNGTITTSASELLEEIKATVGDTLTFSSSALKTETVTITVAQDDDDYGLTITVSGGSSGSDAASDLSKLSEPQPASN